MFKYFKVRLLIMIFLSIFFSIGSILLSIEVKNNGPLGVFIIVVPMIIFIVKYFKINIIISKYEKAILNKDYIKADEVATKYIKYKWMAVLKVNLYLIRGEIELYIYNYNSFSIKVDTKKLRYYNFLFEIYKVYYDLLIGNTLDLSKVQKISGIKETYQPKICYKAISLLKSGKAQDAINLINPLILTTSEDFSKYVYAYIQYLCAKELGFELTQYVKILELLADNDFLKQRIV